MKALIRKYNGQLATALILTMIVSVSMQLVHDQLVDHQHGPDCPMYVVDGNTPAPADPIACAHLSQAVEVAGITPISFLLGYVERQQARAPPLSN